MINFKPTQQPSTNNLSNKRMPAKGMREIADKLKMSKLWKNYRAGDGKRTTK